MVRINLQKYLFDKSYKNVRVFCMGNEYRNNVGHWETKHIKGTWDKKTTIITLLKT